MMHKPKLIIILGLALMTTATILLFGSLFYLYSLTGQGLDQTAVRQSIGLIQLAQYLAYGLGGLGLASFIWGLVVRAKQTKVQSK